MKVHSRLVWFPGSYLISVLFSDRNGVSSVVVQREKEMSDILPEMISQRRVDCSLFKNSVMVELKAIEKLEDVHRAQAIHYCEAYNIANGLLINFGAKVLDFKRVYNKNLCSQSV